MPESLNTHLRALLSMGTLVLTPFFSLFAVPQGKTLAHLFIFYSLFTILVTYFIVALNLKHTTKTSPWVTPFHLELGLLQKPFPKAEEKKNKNTQQNQTSNNQVIH